MNVVFATDNNYAQHCLVALTSLAEHNEDLNVYIITAGLSTNTIGFFEENSVKYDYVISWIIIDKDLVSKLPLPALNNIKHISLATYYRLFIAELLPKEIDKVIYLDCDTIVMGSLDKLWSLNIEGYALAVCETRDVVFERENSVHERLNIPNQYGYFNAGVLVINIRYWRDNDVQHKLLGYVEKKYSTIIYHDQDILNAVLYNHIVFFEEKYNMQRTYAFGKTDNPFWNCSIVHFSSSPKPWDYGCRHMLRNQYYINLSKTPYKEFSPSFNIKNWWRLMVKPYLKKWLR